MLAVKFEEKGMVMDTDTMESAVMQSSNEKCCQKYLVTLKQRKKKALPLEDKRSQKGNDNK